MQIELSPKKSNNQPQSLAYEGQKLQKKQEFQFREDPSQIAGQAPLQSLSANNQVEPTYKSFKSVLMIILNLGLSPLYFGYIIAYLSSIKFDTIMTVYNISWSKSVAEGLFIGCVPIGGGFGALFSYYLLKRLSRKSCILAVNVLAFTIGLILYVPNASTFLLCRFFQGMCAGLYSSIIPLMMKQISPTQISGTLLSFNQVSITVGIVLPFLLSEILQLIFDSPDGQKVWYIVFCVPLFIISTQTLLLLYKFPYQTPKYLISKNRMQEAKKLLRVIYKEQYVQNKFIQIQSDIRGISSREAVKIDSKDGQQIQGQAEQERKVIKTPPVAIFIAVHLAVFQQFCGINAVMAYSGQIIGQSLPDLRNIIPIIINLQQVLASLFASYLLSRIGRKKIMQAGTVGAAISCFIIAIGFFSQSHKGLSDGLVIMGLIIFMGNFGLSLGPVVWVYLPQIVQSEVLPYAVMANWLSASLIMLLFPVIKQALPNKNPAILFIFFTSWCILSYFVNGKFMIQTKGKSQKEIQDQFSKKNLFLC